MNTKNLFSAIPCKEGEDFLSSQKSLKSAWNNCEWGDWMWWAILHTENNITKEDCVKYANWCASRAKSYATDAVYAADAADAAAYAAAYAAADAAYAADDYAADAAAYDAAYAVAYAADAVAYAADAAAYAADAAAHAADAADAAYAVYAAAKLEERKAQADWIRKNIKYPF